MPKPFEAAKKELELVDQRVLSKLADSADGTADASGIYVSRCCVSLRSSPGFTYLLEIDYGGLEGSHGKRSRRACSGRSRRMKVGSTWRDGPMYPSAGRVLIDSMLRTIGFSTRIPDTYRSLIRPERV